MSSYWIWKPIQDVGLIRRLPCWTGLIYKLTTHREWTKITRTMEHNGLWVLLCIISHWFSTLLKKIILTFREAPNRSVFEKIIPIPKFTQWLLTADWIYSMLLVVGNQILPKSVNTLRFGEILYVLEKLHTALEFAPEIKCCAEFLLIFGRNSWWRAEV